MPVSVVSSFLGCETHMLCVQARKEDDTVILFAAGECGKPSDNYGWKDMFPKAEVYVADCSPGLKLTMLRIPRPVFLQHVIPVVNRIHLYTSVSPFLPLFFFLLETSSTRTYFFVFLTKASWLGPLALDPIPVEKEDGIHIPEPSKSVTDGMDKIFPSSGVLFKKTIKAAQELTSGTDSAAAKAAKQQVLKHLQDYRNTVLAFCGISPEEDMVLAGGNKRAKTQSKDASLSKRKANASTVQASGEPTKKKIRASSSGKMSEKDFAKESSKLGIIISDSGVRSRK
jgi:hypothetical protein